MASTDLFTSNITDYKKKQEVFDQRAGTFTLLRIMCFIALAASIVYGFQGFNEGFALAGLMVIFFFIILNKDNANERQRSNYKYLVSINKSEIIRAQNNHEHVDSGSQFIDYNHPYSQDLDLFGPKSLFQQINRTILESSEKLLAKFLTTIVPSTEVIKRQKAIKELQENQKWSQHFQASLRGLDNETRREGLIKNQFIKPQRSNFLPLVAAILSLVTLSLIYLSVYYELPSGYPWLAVFVNLLLLLFFNLRLQKQALKTDHLKQFLQPFISSLELINGGSFNSELLKNQQLVIGNDALKEIKKLKQIVFLMDSRANILWPMVNVIFLVDLYTFWLLNKWIFKNGKRFSEWVECLNFYEVYTSLAAYNEVNSEFTFPEVNEGKPQWTGEEVGHPLIPADKRVCNDFDLQTQVNLITGSNMSGKSTFLRTFGINTLMAWVGLPVCAKQLSLSDFHLYTSMRTHDDLSEGASSFYAELKRIQGLFELGSRTEKPILFLLDEILKGTNSHDRHHGAIGIIEKIRKMNAAGFISTHDLALADEYPSSSFLKNYSFNSELVDNKLLFDYKIHSEKCHSTNATQLMRSMGIID